MARHRVNPIYCLNLGTWPQYFGEKKQNGAETYTLEECASEITETLGTLITPSNQ